MTKETPCCLNSPGSDWSSFVLAIVFVLLVLAQSQARGSVSVGNNEVAGGDWDQYCITVINWSPPEGPGAFIWDLDEGFLGPTGGSNYVWYGEVTNQSTEGATDWGSPYVAQRYRHAEAYYDWYYNNNPVSAEGLMSGGGFQSIGIINSLNYQGVNQGVYLQLSAAASQHWILQYYGTNEEYLLLSDELDEVETGESPAILGSTNNITYNGPTNNFTNSLNFVWAPSPQTNTNALTYALVQVPPITIAFVGTNQPQVNLAPLPGCSSGGVFTSPQGEPNVSQALIFSFYYNAFAAAISGTNSSSTTSETNYTTAAFGQRSIVWYGSYAGLLNSNATSFNNTAVYRDSTDLSNYLSNTNGDVIGQLVTYQVVPVHPAYDASIFGTLNDSSISSYAYQVAMQLGPVMATQPIYSGSNSTYPPPGLGGGPSNSPPAGAPVYPPTGPIPPGGPVTIPTGGSAAIPGIGIADPGSTGDMQATITAQNGTLTLGTTNGLDAISGLGTSDLVIQGPLTDVNAALATLIYQPNSGFVGYDIIQIVANDLGNNGGGTPELTTTTIQVIVTPALSNGTFDASSNFQFTISGVSGPNWQVFASTNLSNWVSLGYLCPSNTNSSYTSFTDTNASNYSCQFYQIMQDSMCSQAIGFINVTTVGKGYTMIADQLINPGGNTLPQIIPTLPRNATAYKWDVPTQGWNDYSQYNANTGTWSDTNMTLNPGEGSLFYNNSSNAVTLTFIGNVPLGTQSQTVVPDYSAMSSIIPTPIETDSLGFTPHWGDSVLRWDPVGQEFNPIYQYVAGSWSGSFVPNLGESFLYWSHNSTNVTWTENLTIAP